MKAYHRICIAIAMATSVTCHAQGNREAAIVGVGTGSCGQYLQLRAAQSRNFDDSLEGWITGFVSGMNNARFSVSKSLKLLPDGPSMLAYVDKYCRDNPLKMVFNGADTLFAELPDWRPPMRQ